MESRAIARRTATRWMEFAREIEIGQIGRFESVEAALKSVDKWRLDEYAARARSALEQDLADLRGCEPISIAQQDPTGGNRIGDGNMADIVPLRQSSGDNLENENYALKAELVDAHDHVDEVKGMNLAYPVNAHDRYM